MKQEKFPLDTMAVLTCPACQGTWPLNWNDSKALQEAQSVPCPQCNHQGQLSDTQHSDLSAHLDNVEKVTGKGSTLVTVSGLAAFLVGIGSFFGLVPIGVMVVVMIPAVFMMLSASSDAKKIKPLRLALSSRGKAAQPSDEPA